MKESREALWDRIARDAAGGEKVTALAEVYGYSYGGMHQLLDTEKMKRRVAAYQHQIENAAKLTRTKMALAAPFLVEDEIETALAKDPTGEMDGDGNPTFRHRYPSRDRMAARHYLLDKILPQAVAPQAAPQAVPAETANRLLDVLEVVAGMGHRASVIDIRSSPHVFEGRDAIPSALREVP